MVTFLLLILFYVTLIAYMFNQHYRSDDRDSGEGDAGGGWGGTDDVPPLDLPPGIFLLPPQEEKQSAKHNNELVYESV